MIEEQYAERINRFHRLELIYPKVRIKGSLPREMILREEEKAIRKYLGRRFVALDVNGKGMDTMEFSRWLKRNLSGTLDFIIGGPWGISEGLKREAMLLLSLSPMTFSHEMVRIMLLEQIYRAFFPTFNK